MKNKKADQKKRASKSAPGWRVGLATFIFLGWVASSAIILYFSNTSIHTSSNKAKEPTTAKLDVTAPFSTSIEVNGRRYRQFHFPDHVSIGSIGTIEYQALSPVHGKVIYSAIEVSRGPTTPAQGIVKFPADEHLSFVPGEILALDPTYVARFRPGEIFDLSMKRVHDVDVDVYLEACTQMRGVTRLNLSPTTDLTREGVPFIDEYDSLKQLGLPVTKGNAAAIAKLSTIRRVNSLTLYGRVDIYPILISLRNSANLRALEVEAAQISSESLTSIAALPQLQELTLSSAIFDDQRSTNNALKILSKAPHLRILALESKAKNMPARINADTDRIIQSFKSLELLLLDKVSNFLKVRPAQQRQSNLP